MTSMERFWRTIDRYFLKHPFVDSIISITDATLLRPVPIIWATLVAAAGYGIMQYVAREQGFALSGSEVWILALFGWMIGIVSELISVVIARFKN